MNYILETENLTKMYGKKAALNNVSIHVNQGDIYGLVGRNGAGKTTFMKIICGLAQKTKGSFSIFGRKDDNLGEAAQRRGLLIESPGIFNEYSAETNLKIKCKLMGINDPDEPKRLLKLIGLEDAGKKKAKNFSLGMKQRLGIGIALAGSPDLVVLDEPINGLDPQGIIEIRDMICRLNRENGTTFIISSHILDELSKIATKYGIINKGELIEESPAEELKSRCESRVELITDNAAKAVGVLERIGIGNVKILGDGKINIYEQFERTGDITLALASEGVTTYEIVRKLESVENYYLRLVGKESE
ncbi:MAG: ATP-binding cassette domain-containing protein [Lachnospiraceae bacterium]|nr:ATP-binding cassette domain-containing protein [Lachnospiraceae bacterium]